MGGGPIATSEHVHRIIWMAVAEARRDRRSPFGEPLRVVIVPTPKFELSTYQVAIDWASEFFDNADVNLQILHKFQEESLDLAVATQMIEDADMLFVFGGSTEVAVKYWKQTGLDMPLLAAFLSGTVTWGLSAGLIIWSRMTNTDSDGYGKLKGTPWKYKLIPALDAFGRNIWICPHAADNARQYTSNDVDYGPDTTRRDVFVEQLAEAGNLPVGIAVDGNTAIHITGDLLLVIGAGVVTIHRHGDVRELREGDTFDLTRLDPVGAGEEH
jgi:hypothetical protein